MTRVPAANLEMGTASMSAGLSASSSAVGITLHGVEEAPEDGRRKPSTRELLELEAREAHLRKKFRRLSISRAGNSAHHRDAHVEDKRSKSLPTPDRPVAAAPSSRSRSQVPARRSRNQPLPSMPAPDRHGSREQRVFSEQTARARQWPGDRDAHNVEKKCVRRTCSRLQMPENDGYCDGDCRVRCLECDRPCMVFGPMCKNHVQMCASAHCNVPALYDGRYCAPCFFRPKCLASGCQKPNVPGYLGYCEGHVQCGKHGCSNVGLGSFNGCCSIECRMASPPCAYRSCQRHGPGHKLRDGCCSSACQKALRS